MTPLDNVLDKIFTNAAVGTKRAGRKPEILPAAVTLPGIEESGRVELPEPILKQLEKERNIRRFVQSANDIDADTFTALDAFHRESQREEDRTILKWFVPQPRQHGTIAQVRFVEER
ncbi:hypothetical protein FACS1894170_06470 [Planctomycetales bacterium]|nr:hypothetical protein FACS1894170_06470 [Planctomycetales bacterium]